jgi:hypothetical protein
MPPGDNELEQVPLRQHLERIIDDFRTHVDQRFDLAQVAIDKAERTMNDRLQGMNEFRDTLRDQAGKFATIQQLDDRLHAVDKDHEALNQRIGKLEGFQNNLQGRMWAVGALIFFGALIINLVLRFLFEAREV